MRTRCFERGIVAVALNFLLLPYVVCAQQSAATSAQALITQAHDFAKKAKTLSQFRETLQVCSHAVKANPTAEQKAYIYQLAGWTYNKRGETLVQLADEVAATDQKRATEYEQAAIKDFGIAVKFDQTNWKPRFNRAVSIAIQGDYQTALLDLEFVIEQQPKHKNALFNRAEVLLQLGDYQRAANDYGQVIELDENDVAAYAGRGIALSALGDIENALFDLNAVVRLQPESAEAYVDRADLYAALGNWERAAGDYRVAIQLNDKLGRAYHNVAWLMATCSDKRFRNPSLAVRAARKAIELDGPTYLSLDAYAAALASAGQYAHAIAAQQKAIATAPSEELANLNSRLALYQQKQPFVENRDNQVQLATAEESIAE